MENEANAKQMFLRGGSRCQKNQRRSWRVGSGGGRSTLAWIGTRDLGTLKIARSAAPRQMNFTKDILREKKLNYSKATPLVNHLPHISNSRAVPGGRR